MAGFIILPFKKIVENFGILEEKEIKKYGAIPDAREKQFSVIRSTINFLNTVRILNFRLEDFKVKVFIKNKWLDLKISEAIGAQLDKTFTKANIDFLKKELQSEISTLKLQKLSIRQFIYEALILQDTKTREAIRLLEKKEPGLEYKIHKIIHSYDEQILTTLRAKILIGSLLRLKAEIGQSYLIRSPRNSEVFSNIDSAIGVTSTNKLDPTTARECQILFEKYVLSKQILKQIDLSKLKSTTTRVNEKINYFLSEKPHLSDYFDTPEEKERAKNYETSEEFYRHFSPETNNNVFSGLWEIKNFDKNCLKEVETQTSSIKKSKIVCDLDDPRIKNKEIKNKPFKYDDLPGNHMTEEQRKTYFNTLKFDRSLSLISSFNKSKLTHVETVEKGYLRKGLKK